MQNQMKERLKLSVIVPMFNLGTLCIRALKVLEKETSEPFEVLIVDDGSTDNSSSIVKSFIEGNSRFRLIEQENRGLGGARNTGIKQARGEYITFLDCDDLYLDGTIGIILSNLTQSESLDILQFLLEKLENGKKTPRSDRCIVSTGLKALEEFVGHALFMATARVYRREFLLQNELYFNENVYYEDVPFVIEAYLRASRVAGIDDRLYQWCIREGSITQSVGEKHIFDLKHAFSTLREKILKLSDWSLANSLLDAIEIRVLNQVISSVDQEDTLLKKVIESEYISKSDRSLSRLRNAKRWNSREYSKIEKYISFPSCVMPKLSIIIPAYNVKKYLNKAVETARGFTTLTTEILLINDGSTDDLNLLLEEYKDIENITIFNNKNSGLGASRNFGVLHSVGAYITFLDGDDWLSSVSDVEENLRSVCADIIMLKAVRSFPDGTVEEFEAPNVTDPKEYLKLLLSGEAPAAVWRMLINRELASQIRFPASQLHEDISVAHQYFAKAISILQLDILFYNWRQDRSGSITNSLGNKRIEGIVNSLIDAENWAFESDLFNEVELLSFIEKRYVLALGGILRSISLLDIAASEKAKKAIFLLHCLTESKNIRRTTSFDSICLRIESQFISKVSNERISEEHFPVSKALFKDVFKLTKLKNLFKGKRCFIIGNGPSLNKHDLSKLENEYTFGVNSIFYKEEQGFVPTFYVVEDRHVVSDNIEKISNQGSPFKFTLSNYYDKFGEESNFTFLSNDQGFYFDYHESFQEPRFSWDAANVVYCGQTVTYLNIQLAVYFGFAEIHLIGMDFSYVIPETAIRDGVNIESTEDDPNHFHPEYFGKGKKWHDPQLEQVAKNYSLARSEIESKGLKIYNATIGGHLEIFTRVDYSHVIEGSSNGMNRLVPPAPPVNVKKEVNNPSSTESVAQIAVETSKKSTVSEIRPFLHRHKLNIFEGASVLGFVSLLALYLISNTSLSMWPWGWSILAVSVVTGFSLVVLIREIYNRVRVTKKLIAELEKSHATLVENIQDGNKAMNDAVNALRLEFNDKHLREFEKTARMMNDVAKSFDSKAAKITVDLSNQISEARVEIRNSVEAAIESINLRSTKVAESVEKQYSELRAEINVVSCDSSKVREDLVSRLDQIDFINDSTKSELGKVNALLELTVSKFETLAGERVKKMESVIGALQASNKDILSRLDSVISKKDIESVELKLVKNVEFVLNDLNTKCDVSEDRVLGVFETFRKKFTSEFSELQRSLDEEKRLSNYSNAPLIRVHNRRFSEIDVGKIERNWMGQLNLSLTSRQLHYMAHQICIVEERCEGRLATTIQAAVLRVLVLLSLQTRKVEMLEIGTLFGVAPISLYLAARRSLCDLNITIIDPLSGYYDKGIFDEQTGVPVTKETLLSNFTANGLPATNYRIIQELSTASKAVEAASERKYDYLLIDGDHSLEGVSNDFQLYNSMVRKGGFLIIDDYGSKGWPAIKPYVDETVRTNKDWSWLGAEWGTAVLRRI